MINLVHYIYVSKAGESLAEADVLSILDAARKNNEALNISGMLLFDGNSFFQVLEGDEEVVDRLFVSKIYRDKRHSNVVILIKENIDQRSFSDWTMGYSKLSRDQLRNIDGMNDFFKGKQCLADLDDGRAKKLLGTFADGRWRFN